MVFLSGCFFAPEGPPPGIGLECGLVFFLEEGFGCGGGYVFAERPRLTGEGAAPTGVCLLVGIDAGSLS